MPAWLHAPVGRLVPGLIDSAPLAPRPFVVEGLSSFPSPAYAARMPDYTVTAVADALHVSPGDVRAVLLDTDDDPLPAWAVDDVHQCLDPDGERTVPEWHTPDALTGEWLTLGPDITDPRVV